MSDLQRTPPQEPDYSLPAKIAIAGGMIVAGAGAIVTMVVGLVGFIAGAIVLSAGVHAVFAWPLVYVGMWMLSWLVTLPFPVTLFNAFAVSFVMAVGVALFSSGSTKVRDS